MSAIRAGQLVKVPDIGLLEIMNALEVGLSIGQRYTVAHVQMNDPRMDTGVATAKPPLFDPLAPLTIMDICWIMDEMVALEVGTRALVQG